jgi:carboxypeptidase T
MFTIFSSMKLLLLIIIFPLLFLNSNGLQSQEIQEKHSLVKIYIETENDMNRIMQEDLHFDHAEHFGDGTMQTWLSESEISLLRKTGIRFEIIIDDGLKDFLERNNNINQSELEQSFLQSVMQYNVTHNILGTMGGYLTFAEVINKLDSMRIEYPNLISEKFSIGLSVENREMWTVRMSNMPNVTTGRPEAWYHSLIHAREPESMMQMIYYMYWLLENYNVHPVATYILNSRELYFTPVFNPDGYEHNRSTNPNGGGFWRKNRKNNGNGSFGVDLNRNYGPYAFWNSPGGGSSTTPSSDTYRGIAPFSEIETRNAMEFVNSRNFKTILSYHTYGNYMIRPWGYQDLPTPDEAVFHELSTDLTLQNHYTVGRAMQTVNYNVRGVTDDWYYQDSGHAKIYSMTPEVGSSSDGFWPPMNRIIPLAMENVSANINLALFVGGNTTITDMKLNALTYSQGSIGNIAVKLRNKGLGTANNVTVEVSSESPLITFPVSSYNYNSILSRRGDSLLIAFNVAPGVQNNYGYKVTLKVKQEGNYELYSRDIYICINNGFITFSDSAEAGFNKWLNSTGSGTSWNTTTLQSHSPTRSFADSPTGNYSNSTNRSMVMNLPVNVSTYPVTLLTYWHRYTIDPYDYYYTEVSNDNGITWTTLKSYNGTLNTWQQEVIDITQYANASSNLKIKFTMRSNGSVIADGVYIDDIVLTNYYQLQTNISGNNPVVESYLLSQNYPNPFNPVTNIKFSLPAREFTSLKVFDNLGREVAVLVNEVKEAGVYNINFNSDNLSSGIYFYTIQAGSFTDTKKMLLIK